jgi:hypothetical protein
METWGSAATVVGLIPGLAWAQLGALLAAASEVQQTSILGTAMLANSAAIALPLNHSLLPKVGRFELARVCTKTGTSAARLSRASPGLRRLRLLGEVLNVVDDGVESGFERFGAAVHLCEQQPAL